MGNGEVDRHHKQTVLKTIQSSLRYAVTTKVSKLSIVKLKTELAGLKRVFCIRQEAGDVNEAEEKSRVTFVVSFCAHAQSGKLD